MFAVCDYEGRLFLLVSAHLDCPGKNPESHKMVLCVCVRVRVRVHVHVRVHLRVRVCMCACVCAGRQGLLALAGSLSRRRKTLIQNRG